MKRRLKLNGLTAIVYQVTAVICGFFITKLILHSYGSEINGLLSSIGQFLAFFSILDLGIGASMIASLYKPLYEGNSEEISKIVCSGQKFINLISGILLIYVVFLTIAYPLLFHVNNIIYTASLVAVMGISQFMQYYFGRVNIIFMGATQNMYIYYAIQFLGCLFKTFIGILLIKFGAGILAYEIGIGLSILIQPLLLQRYIRRNYNINRKIQYDGEPIRQKWNGVLQRIAMTVLENTDIIILTFFSNFSIVSVYTIYNLILKSINTLIANALNGFQALLGNLYARDNKDKFKQTSIAVERISQILSVLIFGCCSVLIEPFVKVYTFGVYDINYSVPVFGCLLSVAYLLQCYRLPYNMLMHAVCCFKETQMSAFFEMMINIVLSLVAFFRLGLIGVALGTIGAVLYRTIYLGCYLYKNIFRLSWREIGRHALADVFSVILIQFCAQFIIMFNVTYMSWFLLAVRVFVLSVAIVTVMNMMLCRKEIKLIISLARHE